MNGALAIFVKTPGGSAPKTRLAAATGEAYAEQWYRLAAPAVASVATRAGSEHGLTVYWAVAEAGAEGAWSGLPTIAQGEGGLGERMARVHAELVERHGFAMLIGADAPQLTADALGEAARWLGECGSSSRQVLGPATDGGFWLYGSNAVVPVHAWTRVQYSRTDTARHFRQSLQNYGEWQTVAPLTDVDRIDDLKPAQQALDALADPTAEQRTLAQWMRESSPLATAAGCQ